MRLAGVFPHEMRLRVLLITVLFVALVVYSFDEGCMMLVHRGPFPHGHTHTVFIG